MGAQRQQPWTATSKRCDESRVVDPDAHVQYTDLFTSAPGRFEVLECGELGDLGENMLAPAIFQPSCEAGNQHIPATNFASQLSHVALLPVVSFVIDFVEKAEQPGMIEQCDERDMATKKVF